MIVIAICTILLAAVIKKTNPENSTLLSLLAVVLILIFSIEAGFPIISRIQEIMQINAIGAEYLPILLKAVGITVMGQIGAALCKDSGENAIAYAVETAAKIAILLAVMPVLSGVLEMLKDIFMR